MKIDIVNDHQRRKIDFYLYEDQHEGQQFFYPGTNGFLETTIVQWSDSVEPSVKPMLSLPMPMGLAFIEKVAEYAKNKGISVKEQSNLAGQLSAKNDQIAFLQENFTKLIDHLTHKK